MTTIDNICLPRPVLFFFYERCLNSQHLLVFHRRIPPGSASFRSLDLDRDGLVSRSEFARGGAGGLRVVAERVTRRAEGEATEAGRDGNGWWDFAQNPRGAPGYH